MIDVLRARALGTLLVLLAGVASPGTAQTARQGLFTTPDDVRIFYEVLGEGEPIIVVHGGPGLDHDYLRPGLDALGQRNTLVYYDQRGTGRSSAPLTAEAINIDAFIEDIDALRETLEYDRVTILGHSFGALIAMEYAARRPNSTRALILMNPVEPGARFAAATAERQAAGRTPEDAAEMESLRASEGFAARDPGTLSQVYRVAFRSLLRERDAIERLDLDLAASTARNGQDVAGLLVPSMGDLDWWGRLDEIQAPALVLHGRSDAPPQEMSRELAEGLPSGALEVLDAGHFIYLEDRTGMLSAIAGFFAGLSR